MKKLISFLLIISLIGCGTSTSLEKMNLVPYVVVNVSDKLKVTGRLLEENKTYLLVALDGVSQKYLKSEIKGFEIVQLPEERLMMENIVRNTSKTASNTAFYVILSLVAMILVVTVSAASSIK